MPNAAPPGYAPTKLIPGGFMNMVAYLKSRGYSDDLAQTLAANIEANPNTRANAELVAGAQAFAARQSSPTDHFVSPALAAINQRDQYAAEQAQGMKADSLASYFQRLGMDPQSAVNVAHAALGRPQAQDQAPLEHAQTQVAEHPPISPEVFQAVMAAKAPNPGDGSDDAKYTWDGQKWIPAKGK